MEKFMRFLKESYTAYHAVENAERLLRDAGFERLSETEEWELCEGGKYFVTRGGSALIAFTVGSLDRFAFKIVATHADSPALKLKENALTQAGGVEKLNVEGYGGGIWYSFFDRPLKIAGRVVTRTESGNLHAENVVSPYFVTIPSLAVHMQRGVNDGFAVNVQTDMQPIVALAGDGKEYLEKLSDKEIVSYDLFLVNGEAPFLFGVNDEFLSASRIDNLSSVYTSVQALTEARTSSGISVAAVFDNEEIGSSTYAGAGSDFLERSLKRIAYGLKFDENEYCKALAGSLLVSLDNAHAMHPNHAEKCDPTNHVTMGGGVVIKSHAGKAYTTDGLSSAIMKSIFDRAGVKYQTFFNRSDMRSGGTLGAVSLGQVGILSVDIGLAELAMHSSEECIATKDVTELSNGLTAFYSTDLTVTESDATIA